MADGVQYASLTDQGLIREENQDSIFAFSNSDFSLFVVADGMGGLEGGKEASEIVTRAAAGWASSFSIAKSYDHEGDLQSFLKAIDRANAMVYSDAYEKHIMSGTTLAGVLISRGKISCIVIGDSRVYRMRGDNFSQILDDHVWQNMPEVICANYSEQQLKSNPQYGRLSNYIGMDVQAVFSVKTEELVKNDVFLLCSDGIYKPCGDEIIMNVIRRVAMLPKVLCSGKYLETILQRLRNFVYTKKAPDNLSAILVKC